MATQRIIKLPKVLLHEHLDCSVRPYTILDIMHRMDKIPEDIPADILKLWQGKHLDDSLSTRYFNAALEASKEKASELYRQWIIRFASQSLWHYVKAIAIHIIPVMQTANSICRITRERIEDAVKDGIIALEIRFAPQIHINASNGANGGAQSSGTEQKTVSTMEEVMEAVIRGIKDSPIPVKLCLCVLRHENSDAARQLADLALKYREYVSVFDLAGDEAGNSGVLEWWMPEAERLRQAGIMLTCHLWETNVPTDSDLQRLEQLDIRRLGHGMRGASQGTRTLEICPTSNVVTGQIGNLAEHPIDALYRKGHAVTINTDGLTLCFSVPEGLSHEYTNLHNSFGWDKEEFYATNVNAVRASSFDQQTKEDLLEQLRQGYSGRQ
jgi:adenosine deaminase